MAQKQRAERRLTTADKWKLFFNQWRISEIRNTWRKEVASIPMRQAKVENRLNNILKGK